MSKEKRSLLKSALEIMFRIPLAIASRQRSDIALRLLFHFEDVLKRYVDLSAIKYDKGIHPKHRLTRYHDFFSDRISKGDRIIDVGCGVGAVANSLAEKGGVVTGIDISSENIQIARQRYQREGLKFVEGDATEKTPDGPYDVVVLSNVLEHLENRIEFLKKLAKVVTPRKWLLRVPCRERTWTIPLRQELGVAYMLDHTHFVEYSEEEIRRELASAGLTVDELLAVWGEFWIAASK